MLIILFTFICSTLSFLGTTDYIWDDKSKTYALERDMFTLPGYRPLHTCLDQILNRRCLDKTEQEERVEGTVLYLI